MTQSGVRRWKPAARGELPHQPQCGAAKLGGGVARGRIANVDQMVRPAVIRQASIRVEDGGAPVYVYLSGYQSPTVDGDYHACHNSDIPFFFNNVLKSAQMTGATKE